MEVVGSYHETGYAHVRELVAADVARAFLLGLREDVMPGTIPLRILKEHSNVLTRPAFEIYGYQYKPLLFFLWGLTPTISAAIGRELLPTYAYFRIYRAGDVCLVHSDRYSCQHSLSLTLGYSDGKTWDLQIGRAETEPGPEANADFGPEDYATVTMEVGDGVLYQGVHHPHGRITPNPNAWSAHLFMHWVDPSGPYKDHAFDGRLADASADFVFS